MSDARDELNIETRQATSGIGRSTGTTAVTDLRRGANTDVPLAMTAEVSELLDEFRRDVATLEAEYRSALG